MLYIGCFQIKLVIRCWQIMAHMNNKNVSSTSTECLLGPTNVKQDRVDFKFEGELFGIWLENVS